MRFARACMITAFVLWSSKAAANDTVAAREQLKIGYRLAQEDKCEEAVPHLQESLRLDPKAITLINLADCEERVGRLADALGHWVDARTRAQAEGSKPIAEEAESRAAALEPRLPKLTVVLAPDAPKDVVVERDGTVLRAASLGVALPVNPGAHAIVVKAPGRVDWDRKITLAERESLRVEVRAGAADGARAAAPGAPAPRSEAPPSPAPARSSPSRTLAWIGFGAAVPALAVGTVTGILAAGAAGDAARDCPGGACSGPKALEDAEAGKTMGTISTAAFIVGAAALAVGVYGLFARSDATTAKVSVGPGGATLGGRF